EAFTDAPRALRSQECIAWSGHRSVARSGKGLFWIRGADGPTCRITEVDNTKLKVDTERVYMEGEVLVIECKEGYVLSDSDTITCSSQGQWKPSPLVCKGIEPENGLSTGAIVGIVIGILAVLLAILVCCCCLNNKSGVYICESKNDKFKPTEQELIESNNSTRSQDQALCNASSERSEGRACSGLLHSTSLTMNGAEEHMLDLHSVQTGLCRSLFSRSLSDPSAQLGYVHISVARRCVGDATHDAQKTRAKTLRFATRASFFDENRTHEKCNLLHFLASDASVGNDARVEKRNQKNARVPYVKHRGASPLRRRRNSDAH
ncbi:unnamed protein product, partial [Ranitomeya imitator]